MRYERDECCGCAVPGYPCLGDSCSRRHTIYYKCDRCNADDLTEDEIVQVDDEDLCRECYYKEEEDDGNSEDM